VTAGAQHLTEWKGAPGSDGYGEAEGSGPAPLGTGLAAARQHNLNMLIDYCLSPQRAMELYFFPNSQVVSVEAGSGAIIMRQILSCLMLAAVWLGSLARNLVFEYWRLHFDAAWRWDHRSRNSPCSGRRIQ
jgi:hypothetical protein